jgi:hypothetical protein
MLSPGAYISQTNNNRADIEKHLDGPEGRVWAQLDCLMAPQQRVVCSQVLITGVLNWLQASLSSPELLRDAFVGGCRQRRILRANVSEHASQYSGWEQLHHRTLTLRQASHMLGNVLSTTAWLALKWP